MDIQELYPDQEFRRLVKDEIIEPISTQSVVLRTIEIKTTKFHVVLPTDA